MATITITKTKIVKALIIAVSVAVKSSNVPGTSKSSSGGSARAVAESFHVESKCELIR